MKCAKCGVTLKRTNNKPDSKTTHHILPKREYHGVGPTIILCRKCHNEYHEHEQRNIGHKPKQMDYINFFREWIN